MEGNTSHKENLDPVTPMQDPVISTNPVVIKKRAETFLGGALADKKKTKGAYMHRFPHPERRSELYKRWISIVGKKLSEMDPLTVYNNKRICDYHFKTEHKTSGHRLIFTAVPSLYLNGVTKSPNISVQLECNYCIPRMYNNVNVANIPTEKLPSHLVDYKKVSSNLNIPLITEKFQLNQPSTSKMYKDEVCDQGVPDVGAINSLVAETRAKYLRNGKEWRHDSFQVDSKLIIPLYDVPHLIKGISNNLITKDLRFFDLKNKEHIVKWKYLQMLYSADKSYGELRFLHKLTEEHINPAKIKKMKVKIAAQTFSHWVRLAEKSASKRL
ncbi:unnamed protein product [Parnassius apollo]|uniref:(apollo) hypothetical protein n=1 Tax=Parnassius apollo TaxID=110799 RepID=A0A8S3WV28_PARAO|nr:unnamed protein product [Parnassius apollo]